MSTEKRILNCDLSATSLDDCDATSYIIKVVATIIPGMVIGICLFLATFLFCSFRFCCNCCGGRKQTANMCCKPKAEKNIPFARYTKRDLLRAKVFMWLVAVLAIASLIWGNSTSAQVVGGFNGFADAIKGVPNRLFGKIEEMDRALTLQIYDAAKNTTETVAVFSNSSVKTEAEKVRDDLDKLLTENVGTGQDYANNYSWVLFVIFSVPSAVVILGAPLALFNIRKWIPMILVWITFFLGTFVWILHGVFAGSTFLFDGVCTEISGAANNRKNIISTLSGCSSSTFKDYIRTFRDLRKERAQVACHEFNTICYWNNQTTNDNLAQNRIYECNFVGDAIPCNGRDLPAISADILAAKTHPNIVALPLVEQTGAVCLSAEFRNDCTIPRCGVDCKYSGNNTISYVGQLSKQVDSALTAAVKVSNTIDSIGNQFANCDAILSFMLQDFDEPCQSMVKGMTGARDSCGMQGFACLGGIYALVFGSKRFISDDYADVALNEDGDADEQEQRPAAKYEGTTFDTTDQEMMNMA